MANPLISTIFISLLLLASLPMKNYLPSEQQAIEQKCNLIETFFFTIRKDVVDRTYNPLKILLTFYASGNEYGQVKMPEVKTQFDQMANLLEIAKDSSDLSLATTLSEQFQPRDPGRRDRRGYDLREIDGNVLCDGEPLDRTCNSAGYGRLCTAVGRVPRVGSGKRAPHLRPCSGLVAGNRQARNGDSEDPLRARLEEGVRVPRGHAAGWIGNDARTSSPHLVA